MPDGAEGRAELEYWKALAEERRLRIEQLQARLRSALEAVPDAQLERLIASIDSHREGWMGEIRRMESNADLVQDDVLGTLDDLWSRVAAERTS